MHAWTVHTVASSGQGTAHSRVYICALHGRNGWLHMRIPRFVTAIQLPEFEALNSAWIAVIQYIKTRMGPTQAPSSRSSRIAPNVELLQRRYGLLQRRAVQLARKQDFISAARAFEAYLLHQPAAERTWISYAQVRALLCVFILVTLSRAAGGVYE